MSTRSAVPRVAMIQPRLDGHGGLEKYGVYVIQALSRRGAVDVISEHEVNLPAVERAFSVRLNGPRFLCDPRCSPRIDATDRWQNLQQRRQAWRGYDRVTRPYDLVIGQTISLPWRCAARRSILLCHFPVVRNLRVDPNIGHGVLRGLWDPRAREQREIRGRIESWSTVIANSQFTKGWIKRLWDRDSVVVNPPIELPPAPDLTVKKPWIVAVGFFSRPSAEIQDRWGYKRQELLIDTFKELCDSGLAGWELRLAGNVLPPTPDTFAYLEELRARAAGYPISFHENCSHEELSSLYAHSSIIWHATGFGLDPLQHPERMEHFGMVTAEAMGWGCVPVVINQGGQPEIVQADRSGILWDTPEQLREHTRYLAANPGERGRLAAAAVERAQHFGLRRFQSEIDAVLDREFSALRRSARSRPSVEEPVLGAAGR